jgi:hypothetical protein
MFAPSVAGEIAEDTRRMTLGAMTNLMCRGRKRGLAGIVATQRLAKLAKNVAAEASNFLMGRTFLDIDMIRAADLLGMERRQAERIRELERGHFLALGPAISRRPLAVKIGPVKSGPAVRKDGLMPLPDAAPAEMESLLLGELASEAVKAAPPPPPPPAPKPEQLAEAIAAREIVAVADDAKPPRSGEGEVEAVIVAMAQEAGATFQSAAALYQGFLLRCRKARLVGPLPDMTAFRRKFAIASAGLDRLDEATRARILQLAEAVPDDVLAPYLAIAAAAAEGLSAPDDGELARVYGSSSPGRIRRLLEHMERLGLVVVRQDFGGGRTLLVPGIERVASD